MKVSKGQSQPQIVAAPFVFPHILAGSTILVPGFDCDSFDKRLVRFAGASSEVPSEGTPAFGTSFGPGSMPVART